MYYFLINPTSRSGLGKQYWERIRPVLEEKKVEYQAVFSKNQGHIEKIMTRLCQRRGKEILHVVILGGDGTVNEAIQGIDDFSKVKVSYIPTGSSNDLAKDMGISRVPEEALLSILNETHEIYMDMGVLKYEKAFCDGREVKMKDRRFMVGCGMGFDAAVCAKANASGIKALLNKMKMGKLTYLGTALYSLIHMKLVDAEIYLDENKRIDIKKMFFAVGMVHRYQGGGMLFCPDAKTDDGLLDFCMASKASKLRVLSILPTIYKGNHVKYPEVTMLRAGEAVISSKVPLWVHTDGEVRAMASRIRLSDSGEKVHFIY